MDADEEERMLFIAIFTSFNEESILNYALQQSMLEYRCFERKPDIELVIEESEFNEENETTCSICQDTLQPGALGVLTECNHWFHSDCIKEWALYKAECCICRSQLKFVNRYEEYLKTLTVKELKELCKENEIRVSGRKRTLIDRLLELRNCTN
jgi:hypothetical protein